VRVEAPAETIERPLVESLTTRNRDIELLARRQTTPTGTGETIDPEALLTDRQYEILSAAYHGGYYDRPRGVTGKDLATNFDVSNPVVHKHLRAAIQTLLDEILIEQGHRTSRYPDSTRG
jgi:predicted DNA binding protein